MKHLPKSNEKTLQYGLPVLQNQNSLQNNISVQNNFLSDPKLKEYENLFLSDIIEEKEQHTFLLSKAETELANLLTNLESYYARSRLREQELRTHIQALSAKLRSRNVNQLKENMNDLQGQILDNISRIQEKSLCEILSNKSDIQTRIQLRLMDSDNRHYDVLTDKVKDQEDFTRSLNDNIKEMERVRDSFIKVKKKVDTLNKENILYKMHINELEMKNSKLKIDMTNMKKLNNNLKIKIDNKKMHLNFRGKAALDDTKSSNMNTNQSKLRDEYIVKSIKETNSVENGDTENKESKSNLINDENINEEPLNTVRAAANDKGEKLKIDIETISLLLSDKEFIKENPRSCSIISSLANILENSKIKISKLSKEVDKHKLNTNLIQKLYDILQNLKINTISSRSAGNFFAMRAKTANISNEIYLNKDQRQVLIESIVTNHYILDTVNNAHFPNIAVLERKLNHIK